MLSWTLITEKTPFNGNIVSEKYVYDIGIKCKIYKFSLIDFSVIIFINNDQHCESTSFCLIILDFFV